MNVEQDITHPSAPRLEAVAAGDEPGSIAVHIQACQTCAAYVTRLRSEAEVFRARVDPVAFAELIGHRATTTEGHRRAKVTWLFGPVLAAAAVLVLWLRAPPTLAPVPVSTSASSSTRSTDIERFKGGLSVAVIRERDGRQERLMGPFEVQASDRIRLEISSDREKPVTAGLLSDDGTWTLLQAPLALGVGTHYSDLAAAFDDTPVDVLLLVGSPADVERARRVRSFEDLVAWRVKSTPVK
jgi:hypothetical protein